MYDCHVHSDFSGDSRMPAQDACEKAMEDGLKGLIFTDHLDYGFPNYEDVYLIDFDKYSAFMDNLKASYAGKLNVLKGIETGIQPHVMEETMETVRKYDFDFVIGSIHIIKGKDPYAQNYFEGVTKEAAYRDYLEEILWMVNNYTEYDILAHIDYITRYNRYEDRTLRLHDHKEIIDAILKKVIANGKGIEVNTGSLRYKHENTSYEYDIEILRHYRNLGGEIVTLGSDAHSRDVVGYKFDYFKDVLSQLGFKYIAHFEQRKPVFSPIA